MAKAPSKITIRHESTCHESTRRHESHVNAVKISVNTASLLSRVTVKRTASFRFLTLSTKELGFPRAGTTGIVATTIDAGVSDNRLTRRWKVEEKSSIFPISSTMK